MKIEWKISIIVLLSFYIIVNKITLLQRTKELEQIKEEVTSLRNENKSFERQIDVATNEVSELLKENDFQLKVYKNFRDSCQLLIEKNNANTSLKIKNLLRKSNAELLEIARR